MTDDIRVFISYTHDNDSHRARVLELSNRLRDHAIDADIDQYHEDDDTIWPTWMYHGIRDARFVLVVCSELYFRRFEGREAKGKGLGSKWEGAIVTQELYETEGSNSKFIPVLLAREDQEYIPRLLRGSTYYLLDDDEGYTKLLRRLTNQPRVLKRPLGTKPTLPPTAGSASPRQTQNTDQLLKSVMAPYASLASLRDKLDLLDLEERQFVIQSLLENANNDQAIAALGLIITDGPEEVDTGSIITDLIKKALLSPSVAFKARVLESLPVTQLTDVDQKLRKAFFGELITIMRRDQFSEVNLVTPAIVKVDRAIPKELWQDYFDALLSQSNSAAFSGQPAAVEGLRNLSGGMLRVAFKTLDAEKLRWYWSEDNGVRDFLKSHKSNWPESKRDLFQDFLKLPTMKFMSKYLK